MAGLLAGRMDEITPISPYGVEIVPLEKSRQGQPVPKAIKIAGNHFYFISGKRAYFRLRRIRPDGLSRRGVIAARKTGLAISFAIFLDFVRSFNGGKYPVWLGFVGLRGSARLFMKQEIEELVRFKIERLLRMVAPATCLVGVRELLVHIQEVRVVGKCSGALWRRPRIFRQIKELGQHSARMAFVERTMGKRGSVSAPKAANRARSRNSGICPSFVEISWKSSSRDRACG
jgi:hypothetical protein